MGMTSGRRAKGRVNTVPRATKTPPAEITLDLVPRARFDLIDVADRVRERQEGFFHTYRRTLCCSLHTTAGYLEQWVCARLDHAASRLNRYVSIFRRLFPHDAGYAHDRMELREELSEAQKRCEPGNADSHLTFMGAGLENCVTYDSEPGLPIFFIDLDGVNEMVHRTRRTTVMGYNDEELAYRGSIRLPVSSQHQINSFNLADPRFGLMDHLHELVDTTGLERGRIDLRLPSGERDAGLTVNDFETLLMRNDLPEAMRNPVRYMVRHGKGLLRHPTSIPGRTREYAVYDLVHLYNEAMDLLGVGRGLADRILARLAGPVYRLFRLKRNVSFLVSSSQETGPDRIVQGAYQSPILIQHQPADDGARELEVRLWRFT